MLSIVSKKSQRLPLLAFVRESQLGEDIDFAERFRRNRLRRWSNGVSNGMSLMSMVRYWCGSSRLKFHDVVVQATDLGVTFRVIEDIWMRGEYEIPGFIP